MTLSIFAYLNRKNNGYEFHFTSVLVYGAAELILLFNKLLFMLLHKRKMFSFTRGVWAGTGICHNSSASGRGRKRKEKL